MNLDKVLRRIGRLDEQPEALAQVARDVGFALAAGERRAIERVARALAAQAPQRRRGRGASEQDYWAGFSAGIAMLLAAHQAGAEVGDAREAALRQAASDGARAAILILAGGPATGAELAAQLGLTPGATSKILSTLRGAGLVRPLGGHPYPKRGARKPHVLTSLGSWLADELDRRAR
ncbi:MAG TPA: MarR family transcriptional regulator, partial [Kofleriaceae bacterium]|nr:MarR family transcriptional regulator [Kofleriaceae bacterium]